jgi:hypothetical protein
VVIQDGTDEDDDDDDNNNNDDDINDDDINDNDDANDDDGDSSSSSNNNNNNNGIEVLAFATETQLFLRGRSWILNVNSVNLLTPELFFLILAHPVYKM